MNNAQVRTHRDTGEWAPLWMQNKLRWIRSFYNVKCMSHSETAKKDTWETSRHPISIFILNTQPISKPTCVTSFYWHKTILFLHSCAALILCGSSPWLLYMQECIRLGKKQQQQQQQQLHDYHTFPHKREHTLIPASPCALLCLPRAVLKGWWDSALARLVHKSGVITWTQTLHFHR